MHISKGISKTIVAGALLTGCVTEPGFVPASRDVQEALAKTNTTITAQQQEIVAKQKEYQEKVANAVVLLGKETTSLQSPEGELVAEGAFLPFASESVERTFAERTVQFSAMVETFGDATVLEQLELCYFFYDGINHMGVAVQDPLQAPSLVVRPFARVEEPRPGVIQQSYGGEGVQITEGDRGQQRIFEGKHVAFISDQNNISFFKRPQLMQVILDGKVIAHVRFVLKEVTE